MKSLCFRLHIEVPLELQLGLRGQPKSDAVLLAFSPDRFKLMRTVADVMNLIRKLTRHMQGDAPARRFQRVRIEDFYIREILASGQHRRGLCHRMIEDFLRITVIRDFTVIDDEETLAETVDFIPAVRHHDDRAVVVLEHLDELLLHMVLQIAIERGKRLIQQDHIRLVRHDACERHPLLLSSG